MDNYDILTKLGSGSFATVYAAVHKATGKKVAIKVIQKQHISTRKLRTRFLREIENMKALKHENIVEYIEEFESDKRLYIVMEYLPAGELFDYVAQKGGLSEGEARIFFQQIAEAVSHCHKNDIAHRDLKLENILLSKEGKPKLVDFGFSKQAHADPMLATCCGSALYASPEMIFGKPYIGPECDIWSLGVILFCMLTACMPFDDQDWGSFLQSINRADYPDPTNVSEKVKHLLSRMLDPCAKTRATIDEVLNHPWFQRKKTSLQLPSRQRRIGISHSKSDAYKISRTLMIEETTHRICSCNCHGYNTDRQDSAIEIHCENCEQPLMLEKQLNRYSNIGKSTVSICSSGYSSSTESVNSPLPRILDQDTFEHFSPRTPSKATIMSLYGCSECLEPTENENIELVFA